jgi:hypothetical protein
MRGIINSSLRLLNIYLTKLRLRLKFSACLPEALQQTTRIWIYGLAQGSLLTLGMEWPCRSCSLWSSMSLNSRHRCPSASRRYTSSSKRARSSGRTTSRSSVNRVYCKTGRKEKERRKENINSKNCMNENKYNNCAKKDRKRKKGWKEDKNEAIRERNKKWEKKKYRQKDDKKTLDTGKIWKKRRDICKIRNRNVFGWLL